MIRLHGTSIAIAGAGVLLRGPSGAGKSDLALRLIEDGACLVSDDQVELTSSADGDSLLMAAPDTIAGLLEVRGLGLVRLNHQTEVPLTLVVDLVERNEIERLPEPQQIDLMGLSLPLLRLYPWEASAPAKVRLAVGVATGTIMIVR